MDRHPLWWVPNALTVFRCILALIVSASMMIYTLRFMPRGEAPTPPPIDGDQFLEPGNPWMVLALLGFIAAALTDWLDGVLAREWNAITQFGRLLDPIADKLLVIGCLIPIMLAYIIQNGFGSAIIVTAPATAIILRDITITWLRFSPYGGASTHVSSLAKLKTALELGVIGLIIGMGAFKWALPPHILPYISLAMLWIAAGLSVYTGYGYLAAIKRPPE